MSEAQAKVPVSALVLIHTVDLQVLLIERADHAGYWQSVTGSLERLPDGTLEQPMQAAIREVAEETGLNALDYKLSDWQLQHVYEIYPQWRYRYAPGVTENTEHVFGLELPAPVTVQLAAREHTAQEWVDWREAAQRVFSWTNVEAIRTLGLRHGLQL